MRCNWTVLAYDPAVQGQHALRDEGATAPAWIEGDPETATQAGLSRIVATAARRLAGVPSTSMEL